jgi:urease accessory protein
LVEKVRNLWVDGAAEVGVSRLMSGLLCRYRGSSTIEARQWFISVWNLVRPLYLQRPVCIPRVWQLGQRC